MKPLNQNKMKQTAVEWLQQALEHTILTHEQIMQTIGLFEQAKEMEKEQIIEAYETSHISMMTAEQYYNETYELDKNNK
jgi:hypothetical protein